MNLKPCRCPEADESYDVIIGSFEPLTSAAISLIKEKVDACESNRNRLLVVLLDPPPEIFINTSLSIEHRFETLQSKVKTITNLNAEVCVAEFAATDIELSGLVFFESLCNTYSVSRLILGHQQSLGRGPDGSSNISQFCMKNGIEVVRLPPNTQKVSFNKVDQLLEAGKFEEVEDIVGRKIPAPE